MALQEARPLEANGTFYLPHRNVKRPGLGQATARLPQARARTSNRPELYIFPERNVKPARPLRPEPPNPPGPGGASAGRGQRRPGRNTGCGSSNPG